MKKKLSFIERIKLRRTWIQLGVHERAEVVLKQIVRDLNRLQDEGVPSAEVDEIIYSYVPDDVLCSPGAGILRQRLPADMRIEICLRATPREAALIAETAKITSKASEAYTERFWLEVGKYVEYQGFLWNYAPAAIKSQVDRQRSHAERTAHL